MTHTHSQGRKKISIIGAGNIGGELASLIARKELADVVLSTSPRRKACARARRSIWNRTAPSSATTAASPASANYKRHGGLGRGGHHRRRAAQARHVAR